MLTPILAAAYALFIWWFSTGLILFLDKQPRGRHAVYMGLATIITIGAIYGMWMTKDRETISAMVCAFTAGLTIWGWHEMAFLMGYLTGPRQTACPNDATEGQRFGFAIQTILWHELAVIATLAALIIVLDDRANPFALWTFALLWGARLSAKLNVFLGVRNHAEEFLPDHLAYLASYFRRSRGNPLFPVSVTALSVLLGVLAYAAVTSTTMGGQVGFTLLAALTSLAVIEHWMLILPIKESALWQWALPREEADALYAKPPKRNEETIDDAAEYFRLDEYASTKTRGSENVGEFTKTKFEGRTVPGTSS